ncbi:MAG: HD domain-containing protein [Armatimonadota bacterium]
MRYSLKCSELEDSDLYRDVLKMSAKYENEFIHSCYDAYLSASLLHFLEPVIPIKYTRRDLLIYAALLHDIGWVGGQQRHHKASFDMIVTDPPKGLSEREVLIMANIARYHRKSPPQSKHTGYDDLPDNDKQIVRYMASILRLADGLDAAHDSSVEIEDMKIDDSSVTVYISAGDNADLEIEDAMKKSDMFIEVYKRDIKFKFWKSDDTH